MATNTQIAVPGSYRQYKVDTAIFLAWLQRTALTCGYQYDADYSARRANHRLDVKIKVANWQLPVREIVEQARVICGEVPVKNIIPRAVSKAAKRAISTRTQFNLQYKSTAAVDEADQSQDDGHVYFTSTLQGALDLLSEHAERNATRIANTRMAAQPAIVTGDEEPRGAGNQFEHLELQDCEDTEWSLHISIPTLQPGNKKQEGIKNDKLDEPVSGSSPGFPHGTRSFVSFFKGIDTEDLLMRICCFFIDLVVLRTEIKNLWTSYREGGVELVPVTMATNAAIALADQWEKELIMHIQDISHADMILDAQFAGLRSNYANLTALAWSMHVHSMALLDPAAIGDRQRDIFLVDAALIVTKLSLALQDRKRKKRTYCEYYEKVQEAYKNIDKQTAMIKTEKRRKLAKERLMEKAISDLGATGVHEYYPRVATAQLQFLTASTFADEAFKRPSFQELVEMDEFLTPVLVDMVLLHESAGLQAVEAGGPNRSRYNDQLTQSIVALQDGSVGAAAILSAIILYDLHVCLGERKAEVFHSLQDYAEECWDSVKHFKPGPNSAGPAGGPQWLASDYGYLNIIDINYLLINDKYTNEDHEEGPWQRCHKAILLNQPPETFQLCNDDATWLDGLASIQVTREEKKERVERGKRLKKALMPFKPDLHRAWVDNPVACGSMMYDLAVAREAAGICLANTHVSIVTAAYIYQSLRSQNLLHGNWHAMDDIIAEFLRNIFFGSLPTTPEIFQARFHCRIGQVPSNSRSGKGVLVSAIGGPRTGTLGRAQAQLSCLAVTDTTHLFSQWFDGNETLMRTLYAVLKQLPIRDPHKTEEAYKTFEIDTLRPFIDHVSKDCERMRIDYVAMTRTCNAFMAAIVEWFERWRAEGKKNRSLAAMMSAHYISDEANMYAAGTSASSQSWHVTARLLYQDWLWDEHGEAALKELQKDGLGLVSDLMNMQFESPMRELGVFLQNYMQKEGLFEAESTINPKRRLGALRHLLHASIEDVEDEEVVDHLRREWGEWPLLPREAFIC